MSQGKDNRAVLVAALCVFGLIVPAIAIIGWIDVVDFDPCETIFRKAGGPCLSSGGAGLAAGSAIVFIGLGIAYGALKNGPRQFGSGPETFLFAWFGGWMAVIGAAMIYAGLTLWLS